MFSRRDVCAYDAPSSRRLLLRLRAVRTAVLLVVVVAVSPVLFPSLAFRFDDAGLSTPLYAPALESEAGLWTVVSLDVGARLDASGVLSVTETLEVGWRSPRRGFVRELLLSDRLGTPVVATSVRVSSPTYPDVPYEVVRSGSRVEVVVGGDAVRPAGSSDVYVIEYQLEGLVVSDAGVPTLRWDTVGFAWATTMSDVRVALTSDVPFVSAGCAFGWSGESRECVQSRPSPSEVVWSASRVPVGFGITGEVTFTPGSFPSAAPSVMPPFGGDDGEASRRRAAALVLVVAAVYGLVRTFVLRRREVESLAAISSVPVAFLPPEGLSPAAAAVLLHGSPPPDAPSGPQLRLMDLVARGMLVLSEPASDGRVAVSRGRTAPSDAPEEGLVAAVVAGGHLPPEDVSLLARLRRDGAEELRRVRRAFPNASAVRGPDLAAPAVLLVLLATALFVPYGPWGYVAAFCVYSLSSGVRVGHAVRSRLAAASDAELGVFRSVAGLRRFLAEAQADQLDSVASDPSVPLSSPFLELLPWAAAFGLSSSWYGRFGPRLEREAVSAFGQVGLSALAPPELSPVRRRTAVPVRRVRPRAARPRAARRGGPSRPRGGGARSGRGGGGGRSF